MTKFKFYKTYLQKQDKFEQIQKFIKYIKSVFEFESIVKSQKDFRQKSLIKTGTIFTIVFLGFVLRVQSFNELERLINEQYFDVVFPKGTKMPSIDQIANVLGVWDLDILSNSFKHIVNKIIKNKTFSNGTIDGYTPCAIDGTDLIKSREKHCDYCIEYTDKNKMPYYVHKAVICMVVGNDDNVVVDHEMFENIDNINQDGMDAEAAKSTGELTCAKKILKRLPNCFDIIVGDALYCNAPFLKEVLKSGKHAVVRVKDERRKIVKKALKSFSNHECTGTFVEKTDSNKEIEVTYWEGNFLMEDSTLDSDSVEKNIEVRFIDFHEIITNSNGEIEEKTVRLITTDKKMSAITAWKIMHKRWDIENTCFRQLKTFCNLEHSYVHKGNSIETILIIMLMSFNIGRLFMFRRLRNFKILFHKNKETIKHMIEGMKKELLLLSFSIRNKFIHLIKINLKEFEVTS